MTNFKKEITFNDLPLLFNHIKHVKDIAFPILLDIRMPDFET
jgi:hypothetical protein